MRAFVSNVSALSLCLVALWFAAVPARAQQAANTDSGEEARFVQQVVELTNQVRAKASLPPLKLQADLCASARWMAMDMAREDYFDHTDHLGRDISRRLPDFGYKGYHAIGENIAGGQKTPEEVVAGWMKSPGHRHNILNADFSEIGVGFVSYRNSPLRRYWVQDFGTRFDIYPVVINSGEKQTRDPEVKLYLYGEEWADRMRLSNDGVHWTAWQPFQSGYRWKLDPEHGKQTIYVELRRNSKILQANATIQLVQETIARTDIPSRTH